MQGLDRMFLIIVKFPYFTVHWMHVTTSRSERYGKSFIFKGGGGGCGMKIIWKNKNKLLSRFPSPVYNMSILPANRKIEPSAVFLFASGKDLTC